MAIELIDKIKPKNGGSFPMVDAEDVLMPDGQRLSEYELPTDDLYGKAYVQADEPVDAAVGTFWFNPDEESSGGGGASVELDTTLSEYGKAADAGAVGQVLAEAMQTISGELSNKQPKGNYVQKVNGQTPDKDGNVTVEAGGTTAIYKEPNAVTQIDPNFGYFSQGLVSEEIEIGRTYRVVLDGKEYICVAENAGASFDNMPFLGNGTPFGLRGNGEPFVMLYDSESKGVATLYLNDTSPALSHAVAIYRTTADTLGVVNFVKSYVEQYISEALGGDY